MSLLEHVEPFSTRKSFDKALVLKNQSLQQNEVGHAARLS